MKIEVKNNNSKAVSKLLIKFLELNENSDYNYFDNESLQIGFNENSGFSYIYLEDSPHISLCLDSHEELCIVYSSNLDGIGFIKYELKNISNLSELENILNDVYNAEDEIRGDNYNDDDLKDKFTNLMESNDWNKL